MSRKRPGLKSPHMPIEYTKDIIEELKRCATDPIYFMKNYVFIRHPKKGKIKFGLYDYQEDLVNTYHKNRFSIILASRQVGKCLSQSTIVKIAQRPTNMFKKCVLRIVDKTQYNKMFDE